MRYQTLSLFLFFFSCSLFADTENLTLPDLSTQNIVEMRAGVRPYRENGIRIEAERVGDKVVIHNYGHGGAGISLSWGAVKEALALMSPNTNKDETVAVMGAGIIGLTTANQLLDMGYSVRVYAAEWSPNTTSEVAAGLWDAFGVNMGNDTARASRIQKVSYDYFDSLARALSPGIFHVDIYGFEFPKSHFDSRNYTFAQVRLSDGRVVDAARNTALMIETPEYMSYLRKRAERLGAQFATRTFENLRDVETLSEKTVFNCLGLGAKMVFSDDNLKPIRGQLIHFKKQAGVDYVAVVKAAIEATYVCLFPYRDRVILGGSYEVGEGEAKNTQEIVDAILSQARAFFEPRAREEL